MKRQTFTSWLLSCLAAALLYGGKSMAQSGSDYHYQYYNTSHGLPSSVIISLAKDDKGFLWLGTPVGLSMYDGYNFSNYTYAKQNEVIGYVNVIKPGGENRLWIGSGAGLFCYVNNEIIKVSAATSLPQGVNDILTGNDGIIWLATENGPVTFSIKDVDFSGKKKIMLTDHLLTQWHLKSETIDQRRASRISRAPDGTIYIAQETNLFTLAANKLELIHSTTNTRDKILSLFPVSRSKIYFDGASSEINKIENGIASSSNPLKLYKPDSSTNGPGNWYVGTRGIFCFHLETGTISTSVFLSDQYVVWATAVLSDNGFLWVASHDGLIKLKPSIFTTYSIKKTSSFNDYYSITELKSGKLLLGANFGRLFEKKDNAFDLIKDRLAPSSEIKGMYEDDRDWLWLATGYQGLILIKNGKTERFTVVNGLHDNSLYQFLKAKNGKLYVVGDQGISEIIVDKNETVSFKAFRYEPNISNHAPFFSAIESPDGRIWLGGEEGIVYLGGDSLHRFSFDSRHPAVNYLLTDKENNMWIATSGDGVLQCRFNKENKPEIVKNFTEDDGLNSMHYLTLLEDKEKNIWAGSSKGISIIGRKGKYKDRVLNFDETDGFIRSGYSYMRLYQDNHANIWVATTFGITSFNPGQLSLPDAPPVVYITGVKEIKSNRSGTGAAFREFPGENNFNYSDNSFKFFFTALDYANQENVRYYYKLDGLTKWENAGNLRNVSFENLSPGNYAFRVKALNSRGKWSENDAVYSFKIKAPFWKQAWFVLLAAGIIVALLLFLIKRREARQAVLQKQKAAIYREQLEIEQIINHFAMSMNSISNTDDLLWDVVKNCISKLNFEDCVIYLKDENQNVLVQKAALGPKTSKDSLINGQADKINHPVTIPVGKGVTGHVALTGKAEIVADTSVDDRYIVDDERRLSEIAVPIILNETVIGVIDSEHSQKNFYTNRHLQVLTTIASLCATKINTFKAEQQAIEKEMEVLRLNKDFATSQLTALRMQMNPHFIFNALNSIQHYILQGNVVEANKYLSKFSKLQRDILHCSSQQFISLEKELEILTAYLQLEQYRFGGNFTYKINLNDEIEPVEIMIPPMILQPFVENSIWHGLMPLQTERMLTIYFDLESDDILVVSLRDNGIGRAASAKLKQSNGQGNTGHESKGMSMVQQRLQLLQQQYDKPFEATISDITDIKGEVMGTQVELKIFIGNKRS